MTSQQQLNITWKVAVVSVPVKIKLNEKNVVNTFTLLVTVSDHQLIMNGRDWLPIVTTEFISL
jgi:hypothetical protein